eukprot:TRINITY_DN4214_c0_g1_i1.p1 TRINITY_DN4214_c0_g1~~TRINITY_DN4214_c0_g1_i1.p1  ORF type:complete len:439 (-),score=124.19 TRINITY_DN4214_c0_g1_i1:87-1403(-)
MGNLKKLFSRRNLTHSSTTNQSSPPPASANARSRKDLYRRSVALSALTDQDLNDGEPSTQKQDSNLKNISENDEETKATTSSPKTKDKSETRGSSKSLWKKSDTEKGDLTSTYTPSDPVSPRSNNLKISGYKSLSNSQVKKTSEISTSPSTSTTSNNNSSSVSLSDLKEPELQSDTKSKKLRKSESRKKVNKSSIESDEIVKSLNDRIKALESELFTIRSERDTYKKENEFLKTNLKNEKKQNRATMLIQDTSFSAQSQNLISELAEVQAQNEMLKEDLKILEVQNETQMKQFRSEIVDLQVKINTLTLDKNVLEQRNIELKDDLDKLEEENHIIRSQGENRDVTQKLEELNQLKRDNFQLAEAVQQLENEMIEMQDDFNHQLGSKEKEIDTMLADTEELVEKLKQLGWSVKFTDNGTVFQSLINKITEEDEGGEEAD